LSKIINPLADADKKSKTTNIMVWLIAIPAIAFFLLLVSYTISFQSVNAQQNTANTTTTTNKSNLVINGKTFPIKYNITGGKLLGVIADNDRSTLVVIIGSLRDNAKLTIELPRGYYKLIFAKTIEL
jgi:hypothetical protein